MALLSGAVPAVVEIPFPDGSRVKFNIVTQGLPISSEACWYAGVVKDAGDDPDITNGALIGASARRSLQPVRGEYEILVTGGEGVGTVTKPGLAVPVGRPAINPVPMEMILAAVKEAIFEAGQQNVSLNIEIIVPKGRELAEKTLNERLGILGGISILGTTGIVRPVSADAWTATITTSMEVATANGCKEIVLSTGRTSEAAMLKLHRWQPEAFVMMGDYLEFSLKETAHFTFDKVHVAGMWGKILIAD